FFFNWESGRQLQANPSQLAQDPVPPSEMRDGDFRNLIDPRTAQPIVLRDPLGVGIRDNVIPRAALSRQALTFLEYVPQPNTREGALNYRARSFGATSTQDNYTARVDHNFSDRDSIFGRYIFNDTYEAGIPFWGHDERNNLGRNQTVSSAWLHTFNPRVLNEFRGGWNRFFESEIFGTTNDANFDVVGRMGLPLVSRLPAEFGPPTINISGPDGAFSVYNLQRQIGPRDRSNQIWQFKDT